jgi:hypothetical protein
MTKAIVKKARRKGASKGGEKKNRLGVKNSLVNNINARKKTSHPKKKSTVSEKSYSNMQKGWKKDK